MTRTFLFTFAFFILIIGVSGCEDFGSDSLNSDIIHTEPWPEADSLFHRNPKWMGADAAYSIDLGNGRVLWLFGDSFIATSENNVRTESVLIRNSVAIQTGYNPSAASIKFYWRTENGTPQSFFAEENGIWFWPGHGIVIDGKLFIILESVRSAPGDLGFESAGWRAVSISNFTMEPSEWQIQWLSTPSNNFGISVSGTVIQTGNYIYSFGDEGSDHITNGIRWPVSQFAEGDLSHLQWWTGKKAGWVVQQDLSQKPEPYYFDGQSEFSIHFDPRLGRFLEIQTVGFGNSDLGYRSADSLTGQWSPLQLFYRPEENRIPQIMIYAAKAHPHLQGADVVITYATNCSNFNELLRNNRIYFPRFLKTWIKR